MVDLRVSANIKTTKDLLNGTLLSNLPTIKPITITPPRRQQFYHHHRQFCRRRQRSFQQQCHHVTNIFIVNAFMSLFVQSLFSHCTKARRWWEKTSGADWNAQCMLFDPERSVGVDDNDQTIIHTIETAVRSWRRSRFRFLNCWYLIIFLKFEGGGAPHMVFYFWKINHFYFRNIVHDWKLCWTCWLNNKENKFYFSMKR